MMNLQVLLSRAMALFTKRRRDAELDEEIRAHLEALVDDYIARGLSPGEARSAAHREFGGIDQVKEQYREQRGIAFLEELAQDVRYSLRTLRKNYGFTIVATLTLMLGLGANTAIFSLLDAVVIKRLPVDRPGELVTLIKDGPRPGPQRFSYPMYQRFHQAVPSPQNLAAMSRIARLSMGAEGASLPEIVRAQLVSPEYFSTLGAHAAVGRLLASDDNRSPASEPVVVLSYGFWQRRFGGSPDVLGTPIALNGSPFRIVGVAPRRFSGVWVESEVDAWLALTMQHRVRYAQNYSNIDGQPDRPWLAQDQISWLDVIGRTNPDQPARVEAALDTVFRQALVIAAPTIPDAEQRRLFLDQHVRLNSFSQGFSDLRKQFGAPLVVLMGMVAIVLALACANLANLMLARGAAQQREIAVRLALGAGRVRVIRQLLVQSLLVSLLGGALGLALAQRTNAFLVGMTLGQDTRVVPPAFVPDLRVFAFAAALAVVTAIVFGLVPAFRATRLELNASLKMGSRTVAGRSPDRSMRWLLVGQVALSLVLLVGAGLFGRSLLNISRLDLGFDRDHVLTVLINPRLAGYAPDRLPVLYRRLTDRLMAVPGVESVSVSMCGLIVDCRSMEGGFEVEGYSRAAGEEITLQVNRVGPAYFATVGTQLLEGREFDDRDSEKSPRVAVVNEAAARTYFSHHALGRRFGIPQPDTEVVGVVRDARVTNPHDRAVPMVYHPLSQPLTYANSINVRAAIDPSAIVADARKAIADVEPDLPVAGVTTMREQTANRLTQDRLVAYLTSAFGLLALGLACVGLYGVMSYAVARRTSEMGVRRALGASGLRILQLVLGESLACVSMGVLAGLILAIAASRLLTGLLVDIAPTDPVILLVSTLVLAAVASLAAYLPARRAARVDPMVALRHE